MSNERKLDIKKLAIIGLPIVSAFFIFIIFFQPKTEDPSSKQADILLIPDSEKEDITKSKIEIYEQEKREKRSQLREDEESKISSSVFFDEVASQEEDKGKEKRLSEEEKEKRLNQLFSEVSDNPVKSPSRKVNKWATEEVEDQLGEYDFEKKKKSNISHSVPIHKKTNESSTPPEVEKKEPINILGKRTRNNPQSPESATMENLIPAVIHGDQAIKNGATVKMRLLQDLFVDDQKIPRNTFIYGIARFNQERIDIEVSTIRLSNIIIQLKKQVIDQDGIKGLYFPENLSNQMSKEIGTNAIDEAYDIATSGAGAIGSVLNAGKSLLKRKNSEKKVNLKANYKIYLK